MIPRYQRILFWTLAVLSLIMALVLARGCEQAHKRLSAIQDESPIAAPVDAPPEPVTLAVANENDNTIALQQLLVALPQDPALRARALLEQLLSGYDKPDSLHPLPGGDAISDVFFVQLPANPTQPRSFLVQVAVINLRGAYVSQHPSGVLTEDLTVRSIVGTIHANFAPVEQVRFLVDGKPQETLAGHTDISRPYPALDTTNHPLHILAADGTPQ